MGNTNKNAPVYHWLVRPSEKPFSFPSRSTRNVSLQSFMGGAEINERQMGLERNPTDSDENLELKFNSGVNRSDTPSQWGSAIHQSRIGNRVIMEADVLESWRRKGGQVIYKK